MHVCTMRNSNSKLKNHLFFKDDDLISINTLAYISWAADVIKY